MVEIFLDIVPPRVTHQQKKVAVVRGIPRFYEPQRLREARQILMLSLCPHRPRNPMTGPLRLTVRWQFPRGRHPDGTYKSTRPDTDNLQKLLKDCMTDVGFWTDDALVVSEHVEKLWSQRPGIFIRVEEIRTACGDIQVEIY